MNSEKFSLVKRFRCSYFVNELPKRKPVMPHAPCQPPYSCELLRSTRGRSTTKEMFRWPICHRFGES